MEVEALTVPDARPGGQHQLAGSSLRQPVGELQAEAPQPPRDDVGVGGGAEGTTDGPQGQRGRGHRGPRLLRAHLGTDRQTAEGRTR